MSVQTEAPAPTYRALGDRAAAYLASQPAPASEADLLRHVLGAPPPPALAHTLLAPLLSDDRLCRLPDGTWTLADSGAPPASGLEALAQGFTALCVVATGPRPGRHRLVAVAADHRVGETLVEQFHVLLQPPARVPRYVLARLGLDAEQLDDVPPFAAVLDGLLAFLAARPVVSQEASLAWAFLAAEAEADGRRLPPLPLIDLTEVGGARLRLNSKPTLAALARATGVPAGALERPADEARVVGLVAARLAALEPAPGSPVVSLEAAAPILRAPETVRAAPDAPGVYLLRSAADETLYVGKARRLRERLSAYVSRPLGPTRRLEGLADAVDRVEAIVCGSDLEALVLEDRHLRQQRPRFNTQQRTAFPKTWLRLPPEPPVGPRQRRRAPPRLEMCEAGPETAFTSSVGRVLVARRSRLQWRHVWQPGLPAAGDEPPPYTDARAYGVHAIDGARGGPTNRDEALYLGPFRNEAAARAARDLARRLFDLDALRRGLDRAEYLAAVQRAWRFLAEDASTGISIARARLLAAQQARDFTAERAWKGALRQALAYEHTPDRLPADPSDTCYGVLRPGPTGLEGFVLERCVLVRHLVRYGADSHAWAAALTADWQPITERQDRAVVRHWLGAQRPGARLLLLSPNPDEAQYQLLATAAEMDAAATALMAEAEAEPG